MVKLTKLARGRYATSTGHRINRQTHTEWRIAGHGGTFRTLRDAVNYLNSCASNRNTETHVAPAKSAETATTGLSELRQEYAQTMERACDVHSIAPTRFTALVLDATGPNAAPEAMVKAAKSLRFQCPRCAGTGRYTTGSLNGKPTGPGGDCFRCNGRGTQSDSDRRRNWGYDQRALEKAASAMLG